jgi:hypothetical protein
MQRGLRKIMALSRSPYQLAKTVSAIIGLRNAMSILFLERTSNTLKARSYSTLKEKIMKRPYTCLYRKYFFINDLKKGILSYLELVSIPFRLRTYLQIGENDV